MVDRARLMEVAEGVVSRTVRQLPPEVRARVGEVPVFFEMVPTADDLASGLDADLLGVFEGAVAHEDALPVPPRVRIWLENIWEAASEDWALYRDEVRITYLHEIGHFLGWDEEEIADRGLR